MRSKIEHDNCCWRATSPQFCSDIVCSAWRKLRTQTLALLFFPNLILIEDTD